MDITKLKVVKDKDEVLNFILDNHVTISSIMGGNILRKLERDKITEDDNAGVFSYIDKNVARVFVITRTGSMMITIEEVSKNAILLDLYLSSVPSAVMPNDIKNALCDCLSESLMREARKIEENIYAKLKKLHSLIVEASKDK